MRPWETQPKTINTKHLDLCTFVVEDEKTIGSSDISIKYKKRDDSIDELFVEGGSSTVNKIHHMAQVISNADNYFHSDRLTEFNLDEYNECNVPYNNKNSQNKSHLVWKAPANINLENFNVGGVEMIMKAKPLLTSYIEAAMSKAVIEDFDDGTFYAEIPECAGLWANEDSVEKCVDVLREALEEWIILKLLDNDPLPIINGIEIGKVVEENCNL